MELYSQKVSQLGGVRPAVEASTSSPHSIVWHKVSDIPGPHLLKYLWWFFANQLLRWQDKRSGRVLPDLVYSPGINCLDADVIVVHIVFHGFYAQVRSELRLRRVPIKNWPRLLHRKLYYKLIMFLERKVYRKPGVRLIAVSSLVAKQLNTYFQRDDVCVIPNAVDTIRFTPEARKQRRKESRKLYSCDENDFVLLLIGNDWKKKGLDCLLKAVASLTNLPLTLLVVGSDDPDMYRASIGHLELRDRVRFERPSPDVLSFYAASDAYLGPSLEDAFNLPILEAMACGLPVIASSQAGASQLIHDGETGFILNNPQNHLQLADLIRRLYTDVALRRQIGESASRHVMANCGWDVNTEQTKKFLESVLPR